jgi:outer membrane protein OmpA-like peptidoglycan-associated protein
MLLIALMAFGVAPARAQTPPSFQTFSKFDFVPGDKVIALEDFTQDSIGDFPAKWNTNASAEIVTVSGKPGRWLKLTKGGGFVPEFLPELPDNFTLEFDLTVPPTFNSSNALNIVLVQLPNMKQLGWQYAEQNFYFTMHPGETTGLSSMAWRQDSASVPTNNIDTVHLSAKAGASVHVSVWRQRQRVRVYFNQEKVWDVPRATVASAKFNAIEFWVQGIDAGSEYFLANVRLAVGAPDTRNKLLTEGKWVTRGILFDVNSDRIKGESYGTLKEIAGVLTETADVKIQIVGHTDSDGDDAANMDLSKRRAAAVKTTLAGEFHIDAGRMDTDGKGESQPMDKNDTPAGKANNRRVEFIKK